MLLLICNEKKANHLYIAIGSGFEFAVSLSIFHL